MAGGEPTWLHPPFALETTVDRPPFLPPVSSCRKSRPSLWLSTLYIARLGRLTDTSGEPSRPSHVGASGASEYTSLKLSCFLNSSIRHSRVGRQIAWQPASLKSPKEKANGLSAFSVYKNYQNTIGQDCPQGRIVQQGESSQYFVITVNGK